MQRRIFLGVLVCVALIAKADTTGASQFKGYTWINRVLKERFVASPQFHLGKYVGEPVPSVFPGALVALLGSYAQGGTDGKFQNGDPNAFSMTLWHLLLSRFAQDIGRLCTSVESPFTIHDQFKAVLTPLCEWPSDNARSKDVLLNYWTYVTGYEFPEEEFPIWKEFVNSQAMLKKSAPAAVDAMTTALFLNPYFLLRE